VSGEKAFELRVNDRDFRVGDTLRLLEWEPNAARFTGNKIDCQVTYIAQGVFGLPPDLCVMSVAAVTANNGGLERMTVYAKNLVKAIEASETLREMWTTSFHRHPELEQIIGAKNIVKAELKALSSTPPAEGKWIAVSERLPEKSGKFIIAGIFEKGCPIEVEQAEWYCRRQQWLDNDGNLWMKVLAWQPLPQPYTPSDAGEEGER
jgi:hypothetical protein